MENADENSSQSTLNNQKAMEGITQLPLIQALAGRRQRRFCMGAEIPEGPLAFKSNQKAILLTEVEQTLVLTSMAGSTGWHYTISFDSSTRPQHPLSVLDLLEEPFLKPLAFIYLIFFYR